MRVSPVLVAATWLVLPAAALASGPSGPIRTGPPVIPYLCHDGRVANVVYENGSDYLHARAKLTYDERTVELGAAPTLYGVRYRSAEVQPAMAWSLRGEEAWLTESPDEDGYTRAEREIARCVRLRGGLPEQAHGEDHGADN